MMFSTPQRYRRVPRRTVDNSHGRTLQTTSDAKRLPEGRPLGEASEAGPDLGLAPKGPRAYAGKQEAQLPQRNSASATHVEGG